MSTTSENNFGAFFMPFWAQKYLKQINSMIKFSFYLRKRKNILFVNIFVTIFWFTFFFSGTCKLPKLLGNFWNIFFPFMIHYGQICFSWKGFNDSISASQTTVLIQLCAYVRKHVTLLANLDCNYTLYLFNLFFYCERSRPVQLNWVRMNFCSMRVSSVFIERKA